MAYNNELIFEDSYKSSFEFERLILNELGGTEISEEEKNWSHQGRLDLGSSVKTCAQLQSTRKSTTEGLICSWVSDFVNEDGTLVSGMDLRGVVPMYPEREPPIQTPTRQELSLESDPDPKAALHPEVSRLWGWLDPESSAKVPDFRADTQLFNQREKQEVEKSISGAGGLHTDTDQWSWFGIPRSNLNTNSKSLDDTQSLCSSGYGSASNSTFVSPEAGFELSSNAPLGNVQAFATNWKTRMDELCQPAPSSSYSGYQSRNHGHDSGLQSPVAGYQNQRDLPLRQPGLSGNTWNSKLAELCQLSSNPTVCGNHTDNSQLNIPSEYQRKYEALQAGAKDDLNSWIARDPRVSATNQDDFKKTMQPIHPQSDPAWHTKVADMKQYAKRYEATATSTFYPRMQRVPGGCSFDNQRPAAGQKYFGQRQRQLEDMLPKREPTNRLLKHRMLSENFIKNHGGIGMIRKSVFIPQSRSKFYSEFGPNTW